MMKNVYKILLVMVMAFGMVLPAHALSVTITPDKTEAKVEEEIIYTIKIENIQGNVNIDGQEVEITESGVSTYEFSRRYYNPGEYAFSVYYNQEAVATVTVKILEEGETPETDTETDNETDTDTEENDEQSNDARLSSLIIKDDNGNDLPISFGSAKTEYTLNLTSDQKEITIDAVAWDEEGATVQGTGTKTLMIGENKFEIIVTAGDNKTKQTYTINVEVSEVPVVYLSYNGQDYGLMAKLNTNLDGFKKEKMTIQKVNVEVLKNKNMTVVYGINDLGGADFFIYREDDGIVGRYHPLTLGNTTIYLLDVPSSLQERNGMSFESITIASNEVDAWVFDDPELVDYALLYGLNEQGEEGYYLYDGKNTSLTEYPESNPITKAEMDQALNESAKAKPNFVLYGSIGAVVLAVIGVGAWFVLKNKKDDDDFEEEMEVVQPQKVVATPKKKKQVEVVANEEDEDDEWLTDHFYKTILGEDDE